MSLLRATLARDWILHRRRLVEIGLLVLLAITVLGGDNPSGFGIVCSLAAASFGAWLGGDENLSASREFLWTRPVDRGAWFRMRFATGLAALLAVMATVAFADFVDLHWRFSLLFAEALGPKLTPESTPLDYARPATFVLLVYAVSFTVAAKERRVEHVLDARWSGAIIAGVLGSGILVLTYVAAGLGLDFSAGSVEQMADSTQQRLAYAVVALVVAAGIVIHARRKYVIGEITEGNGTSAAGTSRSWWIIVLVVSVGLVLFAVFAALRGVPGR